MKARNGMLTAGALCASAGLMFATVVPGSGSAAAPSREITGRYLGTGVMFIRRTTQVRLSRSDGFMMATATFPPGTTTGWHSHPTPVVVAVTAGTLTVYESGGTGCAPHRYHAGQGFIEPPHYVHLARNEGTTDATIDETYVGVTPALFARPLLVSKRGRPSNCPASVQ